MADPTQEQLNEKERLKKLGAVTPLSQLTQKLDIVFDYDVNTERYFAVAPSIVRKGVIRDKPVTFNTDVLNEFMAKHAIDASFKMDENTGMVYINSYKEIKPTENATRNNDYGEAYSKAWDDIHEIDDKLQVEYYKEYAEKESQANEALISAMQTGNTETVLAIVDRYRHQFDTNSDGKMDPINSRAITAALAKIEGYDEDTLKKLAATINDQLAAHRQSENNMPPTEISSPPNTPQSKGASTVPTP